MRQKAGVAAATLGAVFGLSGCMGTTGGGEDSAVSRFMAAPAKAVQSMVRPGEAEAQPSALIDTLVARRSILPSGSSYDVVASAVLAANARAAEAELRSARLRAQAASKNWLPRIGPDISLTSLGDLVANLVVDAVLFDHGRKKAERDFAAADVEFAAVTLSQDTNDRVYTALDLYLTAEAAKARGRVSDEALVAMTEFHRIMSERVRGGISSLSDKQVLTQKLNALKNTRSSEAETAATAMAELDAMSGLPLGEASGIPAFALAKGAARPLPVHKAEAEQSRAVAQAVIDRAGLLPGLSAGGTTGDSGNNLGLRVNAENLLGLGTGANLQAIEAAKEAAARRVAQAEEDTARDLARLEQKLSGLERQHAQAAALTAEAERTYRLFQDQYQAGQRQVMDVVNVYETMVAQQKDAAAIRYDIARVELKIAAILGLLVDGDAV